MSEIMRYPMKYKTEKPIFNYLVKSNMEMEYWLFQDFDDAIKCAEKLNKELDDMIIIYDIHFNVKNRQFYAQKSFWIWHDGKITHEKHGDIELHIHFYVKAGEWMNPNQEWIDTLSSPRYLEYLKRLEESNQP